MKYQFNPFDEVVHADPYPFYKIYREKNPIAKGYMNTKYHADSWYIFKHGDVNNILKSRNFGREINEKLNEATSPKNSYEFVKNIISNMMLLRDPPCHGKLRLLVQDQFSKKNIDKSKEYIKSFTNEVVNSLKAEGEIDLIDEFAMLIPIKVISNMLGIPDRYNKEICKWGLSMLNAMDANHTSDIITSAENSIKEIKEVIRELTAEKNCKGILGELEKERKRGTISSDELIAMTILLIVAGHETTGAMIGNISLLLLTRGDISDHIKNGAPNYKNVLLELCRFNSSVQRIGRVAQTSCEIRGVKIRKGDHIYCVLGSSHHDEEIFEDPEVIKFDRNLSKLRLFGSGIHFCLGSHLALLEIEIAAIELANNISEIALKNNNHVWRKSYTVRCLEKLVVCEYKESA